ncbi:type II secretion system F family protein [Salipaludibacillus daqingensis]|uniref:type II secretion system F family protein n=1 Tax=Salipaludibacillus daqingensis TaxID=3041001 RepID=UPI0024755CD3|nr:type II secretion system F family protein [Salipaludibacillus daqingensis]
MNLDMILVFLLVGIIITYIMTVRKRKKKENRTDETPKVQSAFEKRAQEIKRESDRRRIKQVETHLIDYSSYSLKVKEFIFYAVIAGAVFFILGELFYESMLVATILSLLGLVFPKIQKKRLRDKRKDKLNLQFKEAIASLSSSLAAGRSIENSFIEVVNDLRLLYPDPNTYIIQEFEIINRRVENGETVERAIQDFATRSDSEDIMNFSDVFITCKRTGGNLVEVIRRTSDVISEKIDIQQEVQVMVAQKRFESRILAIMPLAMIALLKYTSGDYLAPMYDWSHMGPVIMTFCLGILVFSFWLTQRIMNIKV